MKQNSTLVMKFGGASVETLPHFSKVAEIIQSRLAEYQSIAVVISAMHGMTDHLIGLAHAVNPHPPRREYDMLITVGERISCSLLAMALYAKGIDSLSFTGSQAGIMTTDEHTDAKIIDVRPYRLLPFLQAGSVVVVAGFQGVSLNGSITTLGRGGSDTTAVALAIALGAEKVEFYKDVQGLYDEDPKVHPEARPISQMTYNEALELIGKTGKVLHQRCVRLAKDNEVILEVMSFNHWNDATASKTIISNGKERPSVLMYEDFTSLNAFSCR